MQWSWITANAFTDVRYGVQTESENPDLQIRCNGFEGFDLAMEDGKFTEAAAYIEQMGEAEQPSKAYCRYSQPRQRAVALPQPQHRPADGSVANGGPTAFPEVYSF